MKTKPKILLLFQNFYGYRRGKFKSPTYGTHIINRKNATYSRVVPYLEPHFTLRFTECTPIIATRRETKFPTDLDFVRRAIDSDNWKAIVAFGKQAQRAIIDLGLTHDDRVHCLPHPISYQWRRALIEGLVADIT